MGFLVTFTKLHIVLKKEAVTISHELSETTKIFL